jgi:hypothetical protein
MFGKWQGKKSSFVRSVLFARQYVRVQTGFHAQIIKPLKTKRERESGRIVEEKK